VAGAGLIGIASAAMVGVAQWLGVMGRTRGMGRWVLSSIMGWGPSLILVVLAAVIAFNQWGGDSWPRTCSLLILLSGVTPGLATAGQLSRLQKVPTKRPIGEEWLGLFLVVLWALSIVLAVVIGLDMQRQCIEDWDLI